MLVSHVLKVPARNRHPHGLCPSSDSSLSATSVVMRFPRFYTVLINGQISAVAPLSPPLAYTTPSLSFLLVPIYQDGGPRPDS